MSRPRSPDIALPQGGHGKPCPCGPHALAQGGRFVKRPYNAFWRSLFYALYYHCGPGFRHPGGHPRAGPLPLRQAAGGEGERVRRGHGPRPAQVGEGRDALQPAGPAHRRLLRHGGGGRRLRRPPVLRPGVLVEEDHHSVRRGGYELPHRPGGFAGPEQPEPRLRHAGGGRLYGGLRPGGVRPSPRRPGGVGGRAAHVQHVWL